MAGGGGGVGVGVEQVVGVAQGVTEAEDGGVGRAVTSGEGAGKWHSPSLRTKVEDENNNNKWEQTKVATIILEFRIEHNHSDGIHININGVESRTRVFISLTGLKDKKVCFVEYIVRWKSLSKYIVISFYFFLLNFWSMLH